MSGTTTGTKIVDLCSKTSVRSATDIQGDGGDQKTPYAMDLGKPIARDPLHGRRAGTRDSGPHADRSHR